MKIRKGLVGLLGSLSLIGGLSGEAKGDKLLTWLKDTGINQSLLYINHINGATEPENGYDIGLDSVYLRRPPPAVNIYSAVSFDPFQLSIDARPPESFSTINSEIIGYGLDSPINGNLYFDFYYLQGIFDQKNIFLDLYDARQGNTLVGTWDVKDLVANATTIPVVIDNGLSYNADFRFTPIITTYSHTLQISSYDTSIPPVESGNALTITYTNDGTGTNARDDATDIPLTRGYPELLADEAMIYSINQPFSILERLVQDTRVDGSIRFEVGHGEAYSASKLKLQADPIDVDFFNDFSLAIRSPIFNDDGATQISLDGVFGPDGVGYIDFTDPSFPFIFGGNLECRFLRGPTSFELISPEDDPFVSPDDTLVVGAGTHLVATVCTPGKLTIGNSPNVPEPGTLALLVMAGAVGLGAFAVSRRK